MCGARGSRDALGSSLGIVVLLAALGGLAPTAGAQLVALEVQGLATADLAYGSIGPPARSAQQAFGPFGGIAVAELTDVFRRRTRAVQTDYGLNAVAVDARLSDVPFFVYSAGTNFTVSVGNGGARSSEELFFQYTINGGELRLRAPGGNFDGLVASVGSTIFTLAPGYSGFLWSWALELRGVGGTVMVNETQLFGDALGLGTPPFSAITMLGSEAVVSIGAFTGSVDLGPLGRTASALITYDMFASVSGPGLSAQGGRASLGDPFDVNGAPGATFGIRGLPSLAPVPTAVPEPSTVALVGLGLAAVGLLARRAPASGAPSTSPSAGATRVGRRR